MIPKLIHQTVADKTSLNQTFLDNIDLLKQLNPSYQHMIYDDGDIPAFIKKTYDASVYGYYERINPNYGPARADFFRYLLLYEMGGIYLDIKSICTKPFDEVLTSPDYLLSHWHNKRGERYEQWGMHRKYGVPNEFRQWHMATPPKHPFLKAVIAEVMRNIEHYVHGGDNTVGKIGVLRVTGPIAYTKAITPLLKHHAHRIVDSEALGFVFSIVAKPGDELVHAGLTNKPYYESLKEPVVLNPNGTRF